MKIYNFSKLSTFVIVLIFLGNACQGGSIGDDAHHTHQNPERPSEMNIANDAHEIERESLYNQIAEMDSLLFDVAFNECNFELWNTIMADNFEFYDDRSGLNTSREIEIESFKDRCSKHFKVTRKLISTEIFPLNNYGAVQLGLHEFYVDGRRGEIARFIHIWKKTEKNWIVTRVVSYDHRAVE